jgi:hypothetical protein
MIKICEMCKENFSPIQNHTKFCSETCREKNKVLELNKKWLARDPKSRKPASIQSPNAASGHLYSNKASGLMNKKLKAVRG